MAAKTTSDGQTASAGQDINFDDWVIPNLLFRGNPDGGKGYSSGNAGQVASAGKAGSIKINVIICVHNALENVEQCLSSVIPTLMAGNKIILVDDHSDPETAAFLQRTARVNPGQIHLLRTREQLFYTKSANLALKESDADLSILLNSDTIVSSRWLEKLSALAFMNPEIGIVGPLSNAAGYQSIPSIKPSSNNTAINSLPDGITIEDMSAFCETWSVEFDLPLVPSVHGFCFCIKKEVSENVGFLDEITFPHGYGEENDYSYRAMDAGYKLVVATDTYVYHAKSRSYLDADRAGFMSNSYRALVNKYPNRVERADEISSNHPILQGIREKAREIYT